ncbi:MAG: hypothetical protein M1434_08860 [Chloroflexi bacterium]|nr:hypothetical protein [Chloroflexota bacterium]
MKVVILLIRAHLPAILIIQGVLAWAPFFYLKYMVHEDHRDYCQTIPRLK